MKRSPPRPLPLLPLERACYNAHNSAGVHGRENAFCRPTVEGGRRRAPSRSASPLRGADEERGMGIFGRIWRVIKGWLLIGVEKAEDPEVILAEAQESMRRELAKAKENAVVAIAQRNQLRQMLAENQE